MLKSPITNQGKIRYIELIKISILIGVFYALISSILEANVVVIYLSSSVLTGIVFVLSFINIVLVSFSTYEEIITFLNKRVLIIIDEIPLPHFEDIQKQITCFIQSVFVVDILKRNMVSLC